MSVSYHTIYHVKRTDSPGFEEYSDFVVVALDGYRARRTHPNASEGVYLDEDTSRWMTRKFSSDGTPLEVKYDGWVDPSKLKDLVVTEIGIAKESQPAGVVCANFLSG
jgi:hypothetical protein